MDNTNSHNGGGTTSSDGGDTFTMDVAKNTNDTKVSTKVKLENSDHLALPEEPTSVIKRNEYKIEFDKYFAPSFPLEKPPLEILKHNSFSGSMKQSPLRGLFWKIFLGTLNVERVEHWQTDIQSQRDDYSQLVELHMFDPRKTGDVYDPLSQNDDSPWKKFFQNQQTQKMIEIDLQRTQPDNDFFQSDDIKNKMLRILFVYSKTNGYISYRQGMHELLAPIVVLYEKEYKLYLKEYSGLEGASSSTSIGNPTGKHIIDYIYDYKFVEHDIYSIFSTMMQFTCNWFAPAPPSSLPSSTPSTPQVQSPLIGSGVSPLSTGHPLGGSGSTVSMSPSLQNLSLLQQSTPFDGNAAKDESRHNEAVQKCKYIHSVLLKQKDNELFKHLENLQIEPQIYLLRWIRLLFGREFHMEDLMGIWDCIFAHGDDLKLIDYLCISMLAYIRDQLLGSDSINALKRIYKYPPVEDVYLLVKQAMMIKDTASNQDILHKIIVKAPSHTSLTHMENNKSPTKEDDEKKPQIQTKIKVSNNNIFSDISISDLGPFIPFSSHFSTKPITPGAGGVNRLKEEALAKAKRSSLPIGSTYNAKTQQFESTTPSSLFSTSPSTPLSISSPNLLNNKNNVTTPTTTTPNITSTKTVPVSKSPLDDDEEEDTFPKKQGFISTAMNINTARNNYFNDPKSATISSTVKHSYVTSRVATPENSQTQEIKKLKAIQKYLGTSLGEIIPILQKAIKSPTSSPVLNNTNQTEPTTEISSENQTETDPSKEIERTLSPLISLEGSENLLVAIAKIKDIKNMLLGELPIPDILSDNTFDTEEEDSSGNHDQDPPVPK